MQLIHGDCVSELKALPAASTDAVICDPPYPCIKRSYGYWTEAEWFTLMDAVVPECRRVLKPTGSAVFVLQPNSERVGRMRTWLWDFLARWGREWGVVQDAYWWNCAALSGAYAGLMRPSVKSCVWLGLSDCYRDELSVLWSETQRNAAVRAATRFDRTDRRPSGRTVNHKRMTGRAAERGGVTPFNVLPIPNTASVDSAGGNGHGAGTPSLLAEWWTKYICPPGGTVLDPFMGSGTTGVAALKLGRDYIGIERVAEYVEIARRRIAEVQSETPLFTPGGNLS